MQIPFDRPLIFGQPYDLLEHGWTSRGKGSTCLQKLHVVHSNSTTDNCRPMCAMCEYCLCLHCLYGKHNFYILGYLQVQSYVVCGFISDLVTHKPQPVGIFKVKSQYFEQFESNYRLFNSSELSILILLFVKFQAFHSKLLSNFFLRIWTVKAWQKSKTNF